MTFEKDKTQNKTHILSHVHTRNVCVCGTCSLRTVKCSVHRSTTSVSVESPRNFSQKISLVSRDVASLAGVPGRFDRGQCRVLPTSRS